MPGIDIIEQFNLGADLPLDARYVVNYINDVSLYWYPGMQVFQLSDRNLYYYDGSIWTIIGDGGISQSYVDGSLAKRDESINVLFIENDIQDSSITNLQLRINVIDGSIIFIDSSINQLFSQNAANAAKIELRLKEASLGSDFYWQGGLLEVSIGSILSLGKNLTLDSSGNIAVVNSPNFSGDVSISQNLYISQKEHLNNYINSFPVTGDLWWQSPRLFFRDGFANRDILQGSLKGTIYPSSPSEGDMFYRIDNGLLFVYDGSRGKYLSASRSTINGGRTTAVAGSTVYVRVGDATQSSNTGYRMFRNGTITAFSVQNSNTLTAIRDIVIRINDTPTITGTISVGQSGFNLTRLNSDFNIGDLIQISAQPSSTGGALNNWIILMEYASRS